MSYVFDGQDGSEVWVPSHGLGKRFVAIADDLANSVGVPTGLEKLAEDWYKITPRAFADFVDKVVEQTWDDPVYRELERGFIAVLIVLLERIGMTSKAEAYAERLELEKPGSLEALREGMPPHVQESS